MDIYEIYKGNDEPIELTFVDEDGNVVNITDYTIEFGVKKPFTDEVLISKSSNTVTEIEKTDAANGEATIYIDSYDTEDLDIGAYNYDIRITDASGNLRTYEYGIIVIKDVVTI